MKKKQKAAWFLSGVLVTIMAVSIASPALAALTNKTIQVATGVSLYINDQKLDPKDPNGNPVEPFILDGTTYLPVRAVSEALGVPIQWDNDTKSVYIGKHTGDKPAAWLSKMDYFFTNLWDIDFDIVSTDNLGNTHSHSLAPDDMGGGSIVYKLNGKYVHLTGLYYQKYYYRNWSGKTVLTIYADNESIWKGTVDAGMDPVEISVNITGISELKFEFVGNPSHIAIGELGLWT